MPKKDEDAQGQETEDTSQETEITEEDVRNSFLKGDEKDMDRISSAIGRLFAGQKDTSETLKVIASKLDNIGNVPERFEPQVMPQQQDGLTALNEKLQEKILNGNVVDALDEYLGLLETAKASQSRANTNAVNKLLSGLEGQPYYDDIKDNASKLAHDYVGKGLAPTQAVELAYAKSTADFSTGLLATLNSQDPKRLEMLKGGKSFKTPSDDKGKLPDRLEKAMQRDISDGLFKDRNEWIANLDPRVKTQYGLEG